MADVFSQIYLHLIFAVKNRQALIRPEWEEELYKYTTKIVQDRGNKILAIGGMPDHVHLFVGMKPSETLSDMVREIKKSTHAWIQEKRFSKYAFAWQEGYAAFSYSRSHMDVVCKYILNQKEHHRNRTFEEEFLKIMADFEIDMGKKMMFDFFDAD
jgi:putative transposase